MKLNRRIDSTDIVSVKSGRALAAVTLASSVVLIALLPASAAKPLDKDLQAAYTRLYNAEFEEAYNMAGDKIKSGKNAGEWWALRALDRAFAPGRDPTKEAKLAAKADPKNADVLSRAAAALILHESVEEAQDLADKATAIDNNNAIAHAVLGLCAVKQGDAGGGLQIEKSLKLDPDGFETNCIAALFCLKSLDQEAALKRYDHVVQTHPHSALAYFERGQFKREQFDKVGCVPDFGNAFKYNPAFNNATSIYAKMLHHLGRYKESLAVYEYMMKSNPEGFTGYMRRGECYFKLGQYPKAIADLTEALRQLGGNGAEKTIDLRKLPTRFESRDNYRKTWLQRIEVYEKAGNYNQAIADATQFVNAFSRDYSALYLRQRIYQEAGKYKEALNDLDVLVKATPDVEQWYTTRAKVHKKLGHIEEAQMDLAIAKHIAETGSSK